jgi:MYXO-CTERM domain-containing protein
VARDGIYSVEVSLGNTALLEYKILPTGAYDGSQLGQTGTCDVSGGNGNTFGNIQVPAPDTSRPVRFYYDSRSLSDPSYAAPPNNRSGGDDLMQRSPAASCPRWLAVGDFQTAPFDRTVGAIELTLQQPGVLMGRLVAAKALSSGWRWKIAEDAAAGHARRYGPSGWAHEPCDTDNVTVGSAVSPGDIVYFTWYSAGGRLQTQVRRPGDDLPDGGVHGGLPLCPPPAAGDMSASGDMSSGPPSDDGGNGGGSNDGGGGDGGGRPLPGIHCNCQLGGPGHSGRAPTSLPGVAAAALAYLGVRARRRRSGSR